MASSEPQSADNGITNMPDNLEGSKQTGMFTISPGRDVYGELTFARQNSSLSLHDKGFFNTIGIPDQYVKGVLHDLTKVSLLNCITTEGPGSASRGKESYSYAKMFPHFVLHGDHHIAPTEKKITEVHFVVDDASTIFYDFDAFGRLLDARPYIEQIARANGIEREIATGPDPEILYFTGKREIVSVDTVLGRISASHNPSHNLGGPEGGYLKNSIFVTIKFTNTATFHEVIDHTSTLLRFLELLVGRPQNLLKMYVGLEDNGKKPAYLDVYWSMPPQRDMPDKEQRPHPSDLLLDAVRQPDAFCRVLANWLDRHETWRDARHRFSSSFENQRNYGIDRLIGAANMFDILPSTAIPPDIQLSERLEQARDGCRETFRSLPESPERDSVLNALGRVGKSTLKQKIRHRGKLLIDLAGERFPDLFMVTDEAVNCRNHYVHGAMPKFDYSNNFDAIMFFTDTLEFVFGASDLIEAGWDFKAWCANSSAMSHPFGQMRVNYNENLRRLKSLIPPQANAP